VDNPWNTDITVKVLRADGVNVYDVMKHTNLVLTEGAVTRLEGALV
jgi:large subunit ribosomal protein L4